MANKVIGIDLGTTNSTVAVVEGGNAKVIPNQEGQNTTPSIVAFTKDGKRLVGVTAKRQAVTNPQNTIYSVKRLIGQKYDDIKEELETLPYKTIKKPNGDCSVIINEKEYSPEEISASILTKLKQAAEAYLDQPVTEAVITVPAYFNDSQRQATKDAGKIAGLNVKRIINEPTAAALAYGADKKDSGNIVVFDFGGGTFDISVLEINEGVIEVKATSGDTNLGGDDIDRVITNYLLAEFQKDHGIDLRNDKMALQRLKEAAEKAKTELSTLHETEINLPYITANTSGPKHLLIKLSRSKLEDLCEKIFERLITPTKQALKDAGLEKSKIDEIVLVGGSTRMPKIQELVKDFFGKEPNKSVNPDEVVATGAAIQGAVLTGEVRDILLVDVTPLSLGIETLGGINAKLIERNTTIPTKKSQIFTTAENNQTAVDIKVVQGEREIAKENKILGQFRLEGIPPAPRGVPQIEVTFDIDSNGIIHVSAKDKATGKEQKISITSGSGLSQEEIDRMVKEAKEHESADKKQKEIVEKRNRLDGMVLEIEKNLKENREKISQAEAEEVEEALKAAKEALAREQQDEQEIQKATDSLTEKWYKIATKLYQKKEARAKETQGHEESESTTENDNKTSDKNGNKEEPIDTEAEES